MKPRPKVYLALPRHKSEIDWRTAFAAQPQFATTGEAFDVVVDPEKAGSLLARTFNRAWCDALKASKTEGVTHFAMLHSDVFPVQQHWLDVLFREISTLAADLVSVVVPIKEATGLTSTAIGAPGVMFGTKRLLTMTEIMGLPETFGLEDCCAAGLAEPDDELLLNTGCWICDLRKPWAWQKHANGQYLVHFSIRDAIFDDENGEPFASVAPEDWNFSRCLNALGARIYATRKIHVGHVGECVYGNRGAWGTCKTDISHEKEIVCRRYADGRVEYFPKPKPKESADDGETPPRNGP